MCCTTGFSPTMFDSHHAKRLQQFPVIVSHHESWCPIIIRLKMAWTISNESDSALSEWIPISSASRRSTSKAIVSIYNRSKSIYNRKSQMSLPICLQTCSDVYPRQHPVTSQMCASTAVSPICKRPNPCNACNVKITQHVQNIHLGPDIASST